MVVVPITSAEGVYIRNVYVTSNTSSASLVIVMGVPLPSLTKAFENNPV